MMRNAYSGLVAAILAVGAAGTGFPAHAEMPEGIAKDAPAEAAVRTDPDPEELAEQRKTVLSSLFTRLEKADDADAAKTLERAIVRLWLRSGSPTVDILMSQAIEAANEKKTDIALELLDAVVELAPDFAEGWNKRATVHFMRDEYTHSMRDIQQVLRLEPRHFGALAGLGMIMRAYGEESAALAAYREALKYHPHLEGALKAVKELAVKVEGRGI